MKLAFCGDEQLYEKFHQYFKFEDEQGEVQGSYFDKDAYNFYHLTDRLHINFIINKVDGITNIGDVIIQKSWYSNKQLWFILNRFKWFNSTCNVVVCMDVSLSKNKVLMSEIVSNKLGYIVINEQELENLFIHDFNVNQDSYILPKVTMKQKKRMLEEQGI